TTWEPPRQRQNHRLQDEPFAPRGSFRGTPLGTFRGTPLGTFRGTPLGTFRGAPLGSRSGAYVARPRKPPCAPAQAPFRTRARPRCTPAGASTALSDTHPRERAGRQCVGGEGVQVPPLGHLAGAVLVSSLRA